MTYLGLTIMTMYIRRNIFDEQIKIENSFPDSDSTMTSPTVTSSFSCSTISDFWTEKNQMALADAAVAGFALEGIKNPGYLYKYSKGELESIFEGFKKQPGEVVNGKYEQALPLPISAKSKMRIIVATEATIFYTQVGRPLTPANMN